MNRATYFDYIEEKLGVLSTRVTNRGKLNILDFHLHSEDFYMHFLNGLYGWDLGNLNAAKQNVEAIDLIDHTNKYVLQVSATCTKQKIEKALGKKSLKDYSGYRFKFISISKNAVDLRKETFENPYKLKFVPSTDIYDIPTFLKKIKPLEIDQQKIQYEFIKKELGNDIDVVKLDSNLAAIINILSVENLTVPEPGKDVNVFEIDRKITFNNLDSTSLIINDYSIHYNRLEKIYREFDELGSNKSFSVLQCIREIYIAESAKQKPKVGDELFLEIIECTKNKVLDSSNFSAIPMDELELCINILVVDTFIRCKIFKNPVNYKHVTS